MLYLKVLKKQEQAKPKTSRRKKIIKIRAEINKIEIKNTKNQQNINLVLRKSNKIEKPLANLTK
jgi:hypothetical protein